MKSFTSVEDATLCFRSDTSPWGISRAIVQWRDPFFIHVRFIFLLENICNERGKIESYGFELLGVLGSLERTDNHIQPAPCRDAACIQRVGSRLDWNRVPKANLGKKLQSDAPSFPRDFLQVAQILG